MFDNLFRKKEKRAAYSSPFGGGSFYMGGSDYTAGKALQLSAVYQAVNLIASGVAQLPMYPYQSNIEAINHPSYKLLSKKPNRNMTRFDFLKSLMVSVLLKGNGYAYIQRDSNGDAIALTLINPDSVKIFIDESKTYIDHYSIDGADVEPCDMIHIRGGVSTNGLVGTSVINSAVMTLGISYNSEKTAADFFESGGAVSGIMKNVLPLTDKQREDFTNKFAGSFGKKGGNSITVLDSNWTFEKIALNPSDAQLLESRIFNVSEIARFFNISPVMLNDLSKSSYSTLEATNLQFLTTTLQPWLSMIELEFENKIFKPSENIEVKFDSTPLLRADATSRANYYTSLLNVGALTPNEIREMEGLPPMPNGDDLMIQVNMTMLENVDKINDK